MTYNRQYSIENEKMSIAEKKVVESAIKRGIALLDNSSYMLIGREADQKTGLTQSMNILSAQDLIKCIKNGRGLKSLNEPDRNTKEKMARLSDRINITNITQILNARDIGDIICSYKEIGDDLKQMITWQINYNISNIKKESEADNSKYDQQIIDIKREALKEVVLQSIKYLDINKLLLTSCFRYVEMLEYLDEIKANSYQMIYYLINEMIQEIEQGTEIKGLLSIKGEEVDYSLDELEIDSKRIYSDRYIKKADVEELRNKLLMGETTLPDADELTLASMDFGETDAIKIIIKSEENMVYFINSDEIDEDVLDIVVYLYGDITDSILNAIIKKDYVGAEKIMEYFDNGLLTTEQIASIQDEKIIENLGLNEKIKALYLKMNDEKDEDQAEAIFTFHKYTSLYKTINKDKEQESSLELVEAFGDDLDTDALKNLYQYGIITLDVAVDWGLDVTEMLSENSIKPTDVKELYNKDVITIDQIKNVLRYSMLSYEEKLDLIYSTFDGESEEEYDIREELVGLLETEEGYKTKSITAKRQKGNGTGIKSREFVTDPHSRWKLISLLDKDYSKSFLPEGKEVKDGHRVFLLPNQGKVVIERMHENRSGQKVNAYGSATYIMDSEEFFKNLDDIIIDGAVNRTGLREISEEGSAEKIIHSTAWGRSIKEYFNVNEENERYSEEDIEQIDQAIENVNRSRKERE